MDGRMTDYRLSSCRRIDSKLNIFHNIMANKFFLAIMAICVAGQALIVNFGGAAFQVTPIDGLHWAISIVVGLLSIPIGVVIRLIPDNVFAFLLFKSSTRERYLGRPHPQAVPSMYMAGNERMSWSKNSVQRVKAGAGKGQGYDDDENQHTQYSSNMSRSSEVHSID